MTAPVHRLNAAICKAVPKSKSLQVASTSAMKHHRYLKSVTLTLPPTHSLNGHSFLQFMLTFIQRHNYLCTKCIQEVILHRIPTLSASVYSYHEPIWKMSIYFHLFHNTDDLTAKLLQFRMPNLLCQDEQVCNFTFASKFMFQKLLFIAPRCQFFTQDASSVVFLCEQAVGQGKTIILLLYMNLITNGQDGSKSYQFS